jgi:Selenophosphate synthase
LACDAQTSGGLLISLPDDEANEFIKALDNSSASKIGNIINQGSNIISVNP